MALKNIDIKPLYNSKIDDIINDFYLPSLTNCVLYKRVSAYFDSNILSLYSKGIENIVHSNGHVYFLFSCELNERDFEIIKHGYEERNSVIESLAEKINVVIPDIELKNLGYLIKHNYVDIKIAFMNCNRGIFHDKFGLIEDEYDKIYFRGSNNETVASVKHNYESFETTCSWNADENEMAKLNNAESTFDDLWKNKFVEEIIVLDIPAILRDKLVSYASERLIFTYEKKENTFVLDFCNNRIFGINNLETRELLSSRCKFYKRVLESDVVSTANNKFFFRKDINYLRIKEMISELTKYALKNKFSIYQSQSLRRFIYDNDLMIEKRRSLGIAIKKKNDILSESFSAFEKVVNKEMVRVLREPQMWDAYHLAFMKRGANFSVPGSGKTSIVYGAFAYLSSKGICEVDKIVMIGPINSFGAWKNEFFSCFGDKKDLRVFDYQKEKESYPSTRFDQIVFQTKSCNLILFNYESLQSNIDAIKKIVNSRTLLVFDEVHRIKSVKGIRANSALQICGNAGYRVVLTGTPIPNGYIDLFNILNILFTNEYNYFFGFDFSFFKSATDDFHKKNIIENAIYPFFCRTNKAALNIPVAEPDNIVDGYCITNSDEVVLFKILYRAFRHDKLLLYIRLIQASCNPTLVLGNIRKDEIALFNTFDISDEFTRKNISSAGHFTDKDIEFIKSLDMTSKFYRGIDLVKNLIKNGNVIVWGIFINTIERIKDELDKLGINSRIITGAVPVIERDKLISEFVNGDYDVLITNPHTLGESVSLHKNCHQAVYFEYSFNLVHMLQSKDRIHRLGLRENERTYYYYLMLDNPHSSSTPIDKKIYIRLLEKEKVQNEAIESDALQFTEENIEEDIRKILGF